MTPQTIPTPPAPPPTPALWHEPAPIHFDSAWPRWLKVTLLLILIPAAMLFLDVPLADAARNALWFPDLGDPRATHGDLGREFMMLEQYGQWTSSVLIIAAVALIDPAGRRRALAIALACLITVLLCYLIKDLTGRARPNTVYDLWLEDTGALTFGGPKMGFTGGSKWGSFPSAHTTGAFALSTALAWYYPRARGLFMTLALLTATQRVMHHAHWLSDTLAGMLLAVTTVRITLAAKLPGRLIACFPAPLRAWMLRDA